jgi:hypothetical protein
MEAVWGREGRFGRLDYVTCWFRRAAEFMAGNPAVRTALVATNSTFQGEQVGTLWAELLARGVRIQFAHRPFQWKSEAGRQAAVHCVIVGFCMADPERKVIFDYATPTAEPLGMPARNINPYLADAPTVFVPSRSARRPGLPRLVQGSKPWDGGHLLLSEVEKARLLSEEPDAAPWIRRYVGSKELLHDRLRWCLWLKDIPPAKLAALPYVRARLAKVAEVRRNTRTEAVHAFADKPTLFAQDRQPSRRYFAIPEVSSENRRFIPMTFLEADVIASNKLLVSEEATIYHFGILSSAMHMAWVRTVAGRLESRYSYAPAVYNNFPWPEPNDRQRLAIEQAAQHVWDVRASFAGTSLATLYDPIDMPPTLVDAHVGLDRVVDGTYRRRRFPTEAERLSFLFEQFVASAAPLAARRAKPRAR